MLPAQQLASLRAQSPAEVQPSAENQSTTAPSSSLSGNAPNTPDIVTVDINGRGKPAHVDVDPGTSDTGASLSDLDRVGLGVWVTWMDGWMNQAYSRLSTTHGHITESKLLVCVYWTRLVLVQPAASLYSASPPGHVDH